MNKAYKIQLLFGILLIVVLAGLPLLFPLNGDSGSTLVTAIGRFHILILHFPIALVFLIPILHIVGAFPRWKTVIQAIQPILALAILATCFASVLGLMLARGEGASGRLINNHMWAGFITAILLVVAYLLYSYKQGKGRKTVESAYHMILAVCLITLTVGSHHGASLVHGKEYLTAYMPQSVQLLLGVKMDDETPVTYDSIVYKDVIEPILEQNCFSCHGEDKVKGKFRMDRYDLLLAGGKSTRPGVVPGDAGSSEIISRIMLPRTDDKAMPPIEKAPLTEEQKALINWWIDGGASQSQTVDALAIEFFPESIEAILTDLISGTEGHAPLDSVTLETVSNKLKNIYGIDVIPFSRDLSDGVYIVTRNANGTIPGSVFSDLYPISQHIYSMNFWRQTFEAGALQQLSLFTRLKELHLNESNVSPADLHALTSIPRLRMLNLYGTGINDEAVGTLAKLRGLKKLMLTGSKLTPEGIAELQEKLKRCEILATLPETLALHPLEIDPITSGTVFETSPNWGIMGDHKHDHGIGPTHGGVIVDKAGAIYVSSHKGIFVFNESGSLLRSMEGPAYSDIHSMTLVEEDEKEVIYGARNKNAEVVKMTTGGEILMQVPFPPESGVTGKFMPTAVVVTPDGRILVADGYGSNVIFQFDSDGNYLSSFGGKDTDLPEKFHTPHGLSLDQRYDPIRLLVSDREKRRLAHFDLQGNYIEDVITGLRRPCAVSILGDYVAVAELEGRVVILDKDNQIVSTLGDNPDAKQWANFKVLPADWQDGIHTAPHGLAWDASGNLYVQDWNSSGRVTKWTRKQQAQ